MAFTTAFFGETIDAAGGLVNIAALADQSLTTSGDDLTIPTLNQIALIAAGVSSGGDGYARFETPSLSYHYVLILLLYMSVPLMETLMQMPNQVLHQLYMTIGETLSAWLLESLDRLSLSLIQVRQLSSGWGCGYQMGRFNL